MGLIWVAPSVHFMLSGVYIMKILRYDTFFKVMLRLVTFTLRYTTFCSSIVSAVAVAHGPNKVGCLKLLRQYCIANPGWLFWIPDPDFFLPESQKSTYGLASLVNFQFYIR